MSLLCKLGFHKLVNLGEGSKVLSLETMKRCKRCGYTYVLCEDSFGSSRYELTEEEVAEWLAKVKHDNPPMYEKLLKRCKNLVEVDRKPRE